MNKFKNFLQESDIFYNLSKTQLELIESICEVEEPKAKQFIFQENEPGNDFYLIVQGQIEILVNPALVSSNPDSSENIQVIATLRQGQNFGEMALIDEGLRSASARAKTKTTKLLRIPKKKLMLLIESYPELGYKIMYNLATDLAQKLRSTDMKLREALLTP